VFFSKPLIKQFIIGRYFVTLSCIIFTRHGPIFSCISTHS